VLIGGAMACSAASAAAQSQPNIGRVEIGAGLLWIGPQTAGTRAATETASSGAPLTLFNTTSTLGSAPGAEVRVGVKLTPALEAEASGTYARPVLRTETSGDFEGAAAVTATERLQQYTIGGGANWYFLRRGPSAITPFVHASAAYLRQLHENATLVDTGRVYAFGGGAKIMLTSTSRRRVKGAGIRADALAFVRSKGVSFDGRSAPSLAIGASFFFRF
jgi:hypothetical protein